MWYALFFALYSSICKIFTQWDKTFFFIKKMYKFYTLKYEGSKHLKIHCGTMAQKIGKNRFFFNPTTFHPAHPTVFESNIKQHYQVI
jgi:hypothetical protein